MMRRVAIWVLAVVGATALAGCGGGADRKGKNENLDRPKETPKKTSTAAPALPLHRA